MDAKTDPVTFTSPREPKERHYRIHYGATGYSYESIFGDYLSGAEEIGDWDNADDEHVWYLLRALADLGETDLASKVPKTKLTMPSKLKDLIAFEASGTIPKISPAGAAKLDEAKKKLDKKRK